MVYPTQLCRIMDRVLCLVFNKINGIRHIKVSSHIPASSGLAERAVQTVKSGISKMEGVNLQSKVTRFL